MMRHLFFCGLVFFATQLVAQAPECDGQRYRFVQFPDFIASEEIKFGENTRANGDSVELFLRVFTPQGDTATNRPLVILAFGGAFILGDKDLFEIRQFAEGLARYGFVTASIDYRLHPITSFNSNDAAISAVIRGTHDGKAAVRFFRKSVAENGNPYGIDTARIYFGGSSAGSLIALHLAYLRSEAEFLQFPGLVDTNMLDNLGGVAGTSGNPGYSSQVDGVIDLCGALGLASWFKSDVPLISLHGDDDDIVPYADGAFTFGAGINIDIQGSASIKAFSDSIGGDTELRTWVGQGHTPYALGDSIEFYRDDALDFITTHMYDWVCKTDTTTVRFADELLFDANIRLFPNPARTGFTIEHPADMPLPYALLVLDAAGRAVYQETGESSGALQVSRRNLPSGLYMAKLTLNGQSFTRRVVLH